MAENESKPNRGRPKTLKRDDVIKVAIQAYWEEGPTGVSLNAICQRAGASKPSVYREFGNDDGLTYAALEGYVNVVLTKLMAVTSGDDSFRDKIRKIIYLVAEDPVHDRGCLFVKMRAAKSQLGPKTQGLIDQIESAAFGAFEQALLQSRAIGEWTGDISDATGAQYLFAQTSLALDMRARGEAPKDVMELALSVFESQAAPS